MSLAKITQLISTHNPKSIFLYGSRARTDFLDDSDYEIGVIFDENNYINRTTLKNTVNNSKFSVYPFKYEEIISSQIDTPFQKNIYLNDLILSGKTLFGDKIIENLEIPKIHTIDLIQDIRFQIGYGLSAMISDRNGDKKTASELFYKSSLYATRDLIILQKHLFPIGYKEIFENSQTLDLQEFKELINTAYSLREGKIAYNTNDLFKNIKYINKFIETQIMKSFVKNGNILLIK